MDNYEAMLAVLQMAKAWSNMQTSAGFPSDPFDDEALVKVEEMLMPVEEKEDAA